jgi:hypothetical protein
MSREIETPARSGRYQQKILLGLVLIGLAFASLWLGSPDRTQTDPEPIYIWTFVLLFALGFALGTMGLMGAERDYPALLSGIVLYFIIGALVSVLLYTTGTQVGSISLVDADSGRFWAYWSRVAATWPYELLARAGVMGYTTFDLPQ